MAAHQAPPSLGFSRQEHWSGLPFPSPMHESESEVAQSCPTLSDPMDCSPPGSFIHGIFQARVLEWGAIAFSTPMLLGIYNSTITSKDSLAVSYKTKHMSTIQASNLSPWYLSSWVEKTSAHRKTCTRMLWFFFFYKDVYSSFTDHCQNLETTKIFFSKLWFTQTMEYY